jgi:hypothetical protein
MLANYAAHPNVGGVLFIGLGCEKTNLSLVERHLHDQHIDLTKPVVRFGIQETGGTQAVIERGVREVEAMLPEVNSARREPVPVSELRFGRVLRALRESRARLRRRLAGPVGWYRSDHRSSGVLRRRAHSCPPRERSGYGRSSLPNGRLV